MAWAIIAAGLVVTIVVPMWGWRPLAKVLPEKSGSPWVPVLRLTNAAQVAGGRLEKLSLTGASLAWLAVLAGLAGAVWQLVTTGAINLDVLLDNIADAGVPFWASATVIALGAVGFLANRVALIVQAVVAGRSLDVSVVAVVVMAVSAWVWARTVSPAVRSQQIQVERDRIASLGPEPAPVSRFALPVEAAAESPQAGTPAGQERMAPLPPPSLTAPAQPVAPPPTPAPSPAPASAPAPAAGSAPQTVPQPAPAAPQPAPASAVNIPPAPAPAPVAAPEPASASAVEAPPAPHTQATPPQWILQTEGGDQVPIPSAQVTVGRAGRDATADVLIQDSTRTMSKSHASLAWDGQRWWVTDLGSTNGTHLIVADGTAVELKPHEPTAATNIVKFGELKTTITLSPQGGTS